MIKVLGNLKSLTDCNELPDYHTIFDVKNDMAIFKNRNVKAHITDLFD